MRYRLALYLFTIMLIVSCGPGRSVPGNNGRSALQANTEWPYVLFDGDFPDPTILVDGKDYYMTFTSQRAVPGLPIYHSTDMVHWEQIGNALNREVGQVWAPDLQKINGKYYIYFPASFQLYVVYADSMEGPWSEPIDLGVRAIDPGYASDGKGKQILYANNGRSVPLAPDGLSVEGQLKHAYDAWPIPKDWIIECRCLESPKIFKRGEWFYLVSAEGGTSGPATSHMAVVHRSSSVEGPWELSPYNPLVHTYSADEPWWSKGHGTIFQDHFGDWWIVYHAYRNGRHDLGRHTLIEPVTWTKDGWPVIGVARKF